MSNEVEELAEIIRPRIITTTDEIDGLTEGSVAMSCYGDAITIREHVRETKNTAYHYLVSSGPAVVLYVPKDQK